MPITCFRQLWGITTLVTYSKHPCSTDKKYATLQNFSAFSVEAFFCGHPFCVYRMTAEIVGSFADSLSRTPGSVGFSCELMVLMAFITYMSSFSSSLWSKCASVRVEFARINLICNVLSFKPAVF